mmetsp:Transcript_74037/g.197351  ORF Transcript_74037/g.197351 Transcript_74037/m.197351 type:complete len:86 (+) Transcript_74037:1609-1866(+)
MGQILFKCCESNSTNEQQKKLLRKSSNQHQKRNNQVQHQKFNYQSLTNGSIGALSSRKSSSWVAAITLLNRDAQIKTNEATFLGE